MGESKDQVFINLTGLLYHLKQAVFSSGMKDAAKNSSILGRMNLWCTLDLIRSEMGNVVQWKCEMSKQLEFRTVSDESLYA